MRKPHLKAPTSKTNKIPVGRKLMIVLVLIFGSLLIYSSKLYVYFFAPLSWTGLAVCVIFPDTNGCDSNPPWGPFLDNPKAKFTIKRIDTVYVLHYNYRKSDGNYPIKQSKVDLGSYIEKPIRISGHFVSLDSSPLTEQCINDNCYSSNYNVSTEYGGVKYISVNVDDIHLEN